MSLAKKLYNIEDYSEYRTYTPIINSFGTVLVQVDDDDYSGDTRVLLRSDSGKYGFLVFGWGSCSGCDQLQGAETYEEIDELIETLRNSIIWFETLEEAKAYIENDEERKGSFYYHCEEWEEFVKAVSLCESWKNFVENL